jgi:hypothetical protein
MEKETDFPISEEKRLELINNLQETPTSTLNELDIKEEDIIFWKFENPNKINNYIVNKGAEGISLGWWNGEEWKEMWGDKTLNVYGWITLPIFDKIFNS